jgi:D-glycero-alpha-D-manno-heptose-7-phosphate kinase
MIVSCAPFRLSFAGGGSDIPQFYQRQPGAVLSCALAKYAFVIVHPFFAAHRYHLKYARTELVDSIDSIEHPILREGMRMRGIKSGIEVVSVADIPAGTGLGSSSSFSVALLNALYAHQGEQPSKETLAREACELEIGRLGEPIGKQDQYAAAYGGINYITFNSDGVVTVEPLELPPDVLDGLTDNMMLFFTGTQRDARALLSQQKTALEQDDGAFARIGKMADLAHAMRDLLKAGDLDSFGEALHEGWQLKRGVSSMISSSAIDALYERARAAGATGGKLAGAGGGGFLALYCPKKAQDRVRAALSEQQSLDFRIDWGGARIAFAE